MKIKITEPYLWLPVDAKEEKVLLHLYSEGEKIDEIAIRLGVTDCDYYAYKVFDIAVPEVCDSFLLFRIF